MAAGVNGKFESRSIQAEKLPLTARGLNTEKYRRMDGYVAVRRSNMGRDADRLEQGCGQCRFVPIPSPVRKQSELSDSMVHESTELVCLPTQQRCHRRGKSADRNPAHEFTSHVLARRADQ